MDIIYRSKNVEKQCRDLKKAQKDFASFGEKIIAKINLIESMESFSDIMNYSPFHCHKLSGKLKDYWSIYVNGRKCSLRMIIAPVDDNGQIVASDYDFANTCKLLNIVLIEEVSNHYE